MPVSGAESLKNRGTVTSGASTSLVAANTFRNGLQVVVDPSGTGTVYLLLASSGTASATNFDIALSPGGSWDGRVGFGPVWDGGVQVFGTGAKVGVIES